MAKWIDRAALWAFSAFAAYILMLSLTDGQIFLSGLIAFFIVLLIKYVIHKFPEKKWTSRRDRIHYIQGLLRKWALMQPQDALDEISRYVPEASASSAHLVQLYPDGLPFQVNQLIDLWHNHRNLKEFHLILTGPCESKARELAKQLSNPSVHLTDSTDLIRKLLPFFKVLPVGSVTKKQRKSFKNCAAEWFQKVHPMHAGLYSLTFGILYLMNRSYMYLTACLSFAAIILIRLILCRSGRIL